ncbi:MAG: hypothetical protein AB1664_04985 [Thermodesulfobacteriota bacterium]
MKCFIASAFEKKDVDAIYDDCVRPVLKKHSIEPLRVDRVEHNEDIDNKIFQLLDQADFAIVDLTYARPSVYYEAGFASGSGKPVVYIARTDHFRARDDDPEGLLRVHFDLQMKNIISWSKPNAAFSRRLDKRLKHVLKPLLKKRDRDQKLRAERSRFGQLSQDLQVELLRTRAENLLKARGFSLQGPDPPKKLHPGEVVVSRRSNEGGQDVAVLCMPSAVKRVFDGIAWRAWMGMGLFRPLRGRFHYVVVSLNPVPRGRITDALSSFGSLDDGTLHWRYKSKSGDRAADVFVHVIGSLKSEPEFADTFRSILARHDLDKKT